MSTTHAHAFATADLRSGTPDFASARSGWATFKREAAAFWLMLSDTSGELGRMADAFEVSDPAKAALLRRAARQPWGAEL